MKSKSKLQCQIKTKKIYKKIKANELEKLHNSFVFQFEYSKNYYSLI